MALTLDQVNRPELEITNATVGSGLLINANSGTVQNIAINGFIDSAIFVNDGQIRVSATVTGAANRAIIRRNLFGMNADGTDAGVTEQDGVVALGAAIISNNIFTYVEGDATLLSRDFAGFENTEVVTVENNEMSFGGDLANVIDFIQDLSFNSIVRGNYIHDYVANPSYTTAVAFRGKAIELWYGAANNLIENNTIERMMSSGISINAGSTNNIIRKNIIRGTTGGSSGGGGAGILIESANGPTSQNLITQNHFSGNHSISIDLSVLDPGDSVTLNDGATNATQANIGLDFPVIISATISGTTLTVTGTAALAPGGQVEIYRAVADGDGSDTSGANDYGEGVEYLGALAVDGAGNFSGTITTSSISAGNFISGITQDISDNTSEFAANFPVSAVQAISGVVFEDVNYGGGAGRDLATSTGVGINGVRVELYRDNGGTFQFVSATTTLNIAGQDGAYEFTGIVADDYRVRVVNNAVDDVASTRTGFTAARGVQTFRTDASTGTAIAAPNDVGGYDPAQTDDAASVTVAGTAIAAGGVSGGVDDALTWAPVTVGATGVGDVDFGFNFDAIVNTNDSGIGSLRQFILNANELANAGLAQVGQTAGLETSIFMIPGAGDALGRAVDPNYTIATTHFTISPASALPNITDPIYLDGQTQAEFTTATTPIIELDGTAAGGVNGLALVAGSAGSTIRGFVINRFGDSGIVINGATASGNTISGNYIGTDVTGVLDLGNIADGVEIIDAPTNIIGGTLAGARNIISGNDDDGVEISGATATGNTVLGNYIGTDVTGLLGLGNADEGIEISNASGNTVGGTIAGARNVISGNGDIGIKIDNIGAVGNVVLGNYIGTDVTGAVDLGNSTDGIEISDAPNNTIGGTIAGARNIISGNDDNGILIAGVTATGNIVQGNYIGTDVTGTLDLGNAEHGIFINAAPSNTIGGSASRSRAT